MKWYYIELDVHTSILISLIPILISSLIRNLKFIARLSAIANFCMLIGLIVILYYCSFDLPSINSRAYVAHWSTIPLFFGTSIFAFEGISLVTITYILYFTLKLSLLYNTLFCIHCRFCL